MFTLSKIELNFCVEIVDDPKLAEIPNVGDRILDVGYIFEMLIAETNLDVCHTLYDSSSM